MPIGGARGDATLEVDGTVYTILFTNRALADAERATGKAITALLRDATLGALGMGDLANLLHVGLEASRREERRGGRSYTMSDAWEILDGLGMTKVATAIYEAVAAVIGYESEEGADDDDGPPA